MAKRKSFIKRASARDVPRLKRKLWTIFSRRVKERDGSRCFSCGAKDLSGSGWHAGHLFPAGSHSKLRFHPGNVFSQCYRCNINLGGNGAQFSANFILRYGKETFDSLTRASREMKKWYAYELEELIEKISRSWSEYAQHYEQEYGPALGIY